MPMEDTPQDTSGSNRPPLPEADQIFARRLRNMREAAELTQREIAERMTAAGYQMHQTTIAKIEAGQRPVPIGEATTLATVLGIRLEALASEPTPSRDLARAEVERAAHKRAMAELATERESHAARIAEIDSDVAARKARVDELDEAFRPPRVPSERRSR